jgi:hypothetical protein
MRKGEQLPESQVFWIVVARKFLKLDGNMDYNRDKAIQYWSLEMCRKVDWR